MQVLTTAGHVDHGKSTLIERLTGIDPDRLAEEKARGLTIDLGFAWLTLPSGREVGIVDVPGHRRFVHNMLAGVGSVDSAVFVVAANEGWMPQSEEHLAILDLLGARHGVVALTKADLVEPVELEAAHSRVLDRLRGTTLEGSAVVPVSAVTGAGIDELLAELDRMLDAAGDPPDQGRPRLFVDRSFSVKGAGTVVTGTLTGGPLRVEDAVVVLPSGRRARVRGIQSHKRSVAAAEPVSRVALNLAGIERTEVGRGDAVVLPDRWRPTRALDVELRAIRSLDRPLGNRGAYKAHIGSAEVDARVTLYGAVSSESPSPGIAPPGAASLRAGETVLARLNLASPVVAAPFDHVVLRDAGRQTTVGGGRVLDPHPPDHRGRARAERIAQLSARAAAPPDDVPTLVVAERGVVARADLPWLSGSAAPPADAVELKTFVLSKDRFDALAAAVEQALASFHQAEPLAPAMSRDRLRTVVDDDRLLAELIDALDGRVAAEGSLVRLASHRVVLSPEQEAARAAILRALSDAGFAPPSRAELERTHGQKLVRALLDADVLVKVSDDLVFAAGQVERAKELIADAVAREGPLTTSRIREVLGTSRKYAIPLLEHLDAAGFTRRRGDRREPAGW